MSMFLKVIIKMFGFFVGADGFWSKVIFPGIEEADKSNEEKRNEYLFVFHPIIASVWFYIVFVFLTRTWTIIFNIASHPEYADGLWVIVYIFSLVLKTGWEIIYLFIKMVNDYLDYILSPITPVFPYNPLFKFTTICFYLIVYRFTRRRSEKRTLAAGAGLKRVFPGLENILQEIYIEIPETGKLRLSSQWNHIRNNLGVIISCNFICFFILNLCLGFASSFVWDTQCVYLIPFTGFFGFMEAYHYLGFSDADENRRKKNSAMDLMRLRISYQQYAEEQQISMEHIYRRNYDFVKEEIQTAEEKYMESEDPVTLYLYQYLEERQQLKNIDIAVRLLNGENVFYASPFYRDIDGCIFFMMFQTLLRQKKGLILTEDDGNLSQLAEWLEQGLGSVSGLKKLWSVAIVREELKKPDIGILPLQNIGLGQDMNDITDFLRDVSFAVVLKASDMLIGGQETMIALAEHICADSSKCVWLLCDWNAESMLDLFSHLLGAEFIYVNATPVGAKEAIVSYWNMETEPNYIWDPAQRFLGLETGIAEVAGRNQIACTYWYGERWMPVMDMAWLIGQYYQIYSKKIAQPANQSKMNTQIQCNTSCIMCEKENEKFLVVEDSCCNLYETGRQYMSRAKAKVYVHVLSPNYLLRDYMKAHEIIMESDPKYIAQFVPEYVNSIRNISLHLLRDLLEREVSGYEIYERLRESEEFPGLLCTSFEDFRVKETIGYIVQILLGIKIDQTSDIRYSIQYVFSDKKEGIIREFKYYIASAEVRKRFHRYFRQAGYVDEAGVKCYIHHLMLAGHLDLKYLPGQYVTLNGKYYQVKQIVEDEEIFLSVIRASEQVTERFYYRQIRKYKRQSEKIFGEKLVFDKNGIKMKRMILDFSSETTGYLTIRGNWNDFENSRECICERPIKRYEKKQVLYVTMPDEMMETQLFYFAAIVHDMFYTLYPQYCYLLSVCLGWYGNEEEKKRYRGILSEWDNNVNDDNIKRSFFIVEDSCDDMGLLRSIERHFNRILDIVFDYMEWEKETKRNYFNRKE